MKSVEMKFYKHFWIFSAIILCLLELSGSHEIVSLVVPALADPRENATLSCKYRMGDDLLYSAKWFKNDREIFRFMASERQKAMAFQAEGVHIANDPKCTNVACDIVLTNLVPTTAGIYSCEVSTEAPTFSTVLKRSNMSIAALARNPPQIDGLSQKYSLGDEIRINCTSDPTLPPWDLKLFINDVEQSLETVEGPFTTEPDKLGLTRTILEFKKTVEKTLFRDGVLKISCVSTSPDGLVDGPYRREKVVYSDLQTPKSLDLSWPSLPLCGNRCGYPASMKKKPMGNIIYEHFLTPYILPFATMIGVQGLVLCDSKLTWCNLYPLNGREDFGLLIYFSGSIHHIIKSIKIIELSGSHEIVSLVVPALADPRENATLSCRYRMGNELLYSAKWFKNDDEIFRYMPGETRKALSFPVEGVHLAKEPQCSHVACDIELTDLVPITGGSYRCEVSTEAPTFSAVQKHSNMSIVALARKEPHIEGLLEKYSLGDEIKINCTSDPTLPPWNLKWFINDVEPSFLDVEGPWTTAPDRLGLTRTILGFRKTVEKTLFRDGVMKISCVATSPNGLVGGPYKNEKVEYSDLQSPAFLDLSWSSSSSSQPGLCVFIISWLNYILFLT